MKGIFSNILKVAAPWLIGFAFCVAGVLFLRRILTGRARSVVSWLGTIVSVIVLAITAGKIGELLPQVSSDSPHARGIDVMKFALAITAMSFVFYEIRRVGERRPIAERWKKFAGITMGVAGILFYFNSLKFGYPQYYHRWDQYHYYMGAKYFPEIGYDGLYKCTAIAQDEIGRVKVDVDGNGERPYDLRAEVRKSDKKIRNLSGDNLLMKVDELLAHPEICRDRFTPERWEQYKRDVTFFATQCYLDNYWTTMQQDHGYNPPPVWTIAGKFVGNLHVDLKDTPAGFEFGGDARRRDLQILAVIDVLYILGSFFAIYWAFGWRIFAVCAVFFGTQSSAPFYWTGGALLRQDWLFFFVLSACLIRKKYFALSAAAMVYAGLLRVFPGLVVIGWLGVVGWQLYRHRKLTDVQKRMLFGGTLAAGILIGTSIMYVGPKPESPLFSKERVTAGIDSYKRFFHHTINVHDQTPLTNHMGLRVLIGHDVGFEGSGRMRYTKDASHTDPFETWKAMRVQRYIDYKPVAYALFATTFLAMMLVLRRAKNMWVAQALAGVWVILLSQLTCYYYTYMMMAGTLSRISRRVEVYLFAFCAISQLGWRSIGYNDDRYDYLTLASLIVSYVVLLMFAPRELTWAERAALKVPQDLRQRILFELKHMSGTVLGALIAFLPGLVMALMGAVRKDWSTVLLGGIAIVGGLGLYGWSFIQRGPRTRTAQTIAAAPVPQR